MPGYSDPGFDTLSLHAGAQPDPATGARATPIHLTTSFVFESSDHAASLFNLERPGHVYSRISDPTNAVLEQRMSGPGGRRRRDCRSQRPGGAAPGSICHADGRGQPHRGQRARCTAAARTCCTTRCAALASRPPLSSPATSMAGKPPCAQHQALLRRNRGQPRPGCAGHPTVSADRARSRCAAAGGLHPHLALADQAVRARRGPGLPLGHQVPVGPRHGDWRHRGGWRQL